MAAYVVAQFARGVADEVVGRKAASSVGQKLRRVLRQHNAVPLPSSVSDQGSGAEYHTIEAPDLEGANRLAAALRDMEGVEAAYVKPGEELP